MSDCELNLEGAIQPFGLLLVANRLNGMTQGEVLDVLVPDGEILDTILKIVDRSPNRVLDYGREGERFRIRIEKGASS